MSPKGGVRLERVPAYWRGNPARLDAIEFATGMSPGEIATGLRRGRIDLGRDLLPADLDALLLEPRFRSGLVERTRKNVYFALMNGAGPLTRHPALRKVLAAAFNTYDLVWRTLGRFAQPATSLIPPGMLGHDAGRRPRKLDLEAALAELAKLDLPEPRELRLLVHPVLLGKYRPLLEALEAAWKRVGFGCTIVNRDRAGFHARYRDSAGIDILLARWNTDYDDPDNFTYNVFHSKAGIYHAYYGSAAADDLLERARRLRRPSSRAELYRDFEDLLADDAAVLPLFYDVDYRLAGARLRGLELRSTYPHVSYAELALEREPRHRAGAADLRPRRRAGGAFAPGAARDRPPGPEHRRPARRGVDGVRDPAAARRQRPADAAPGRRGRSFGRRHAAAPAAAAGAGVPRRPAAHPARRPGLRSNGWIRAATTPPWRRCCCRSAAPPRCAPIRRPSSAARRGEARVVARIVGVVAVVLAGELAELPVDPVIGQRRLPGLGVGLRVVEGELDGQPVRSRATTSAR